MRAGFTSLNCILRREICDPADRRRYIQQACTAAEVLRREVESLLAANGRVGPFLEDPASAAPLGILVSAGLRTEAAETETPNLEKPSQRIGRYKLLEQIGDGGFGTVWLAEQEEPVGRRVALKVIKLGMDTKQLVARFEAERQALAMMDHPNIAKVFDGGTIETRRPYF